MAKAGERNVVKKSEQTQERVRVVARGGKTRNSSVRSGRSGSDSNAKSGFRGH